MIVVPIYLAIDTDDENVTRAVAEEFADQPWTTDLIGGETVDYKTCLIEFCGEAPVLLRPDVAASPGTGAKTYLPVPGRKMASKS